MTALLDEETIYELCGTCDGEGFDTDLICEHCGGAGYIAHDC